MPKFFVLPEQVAEPNIRIIGEDVAHIRRVLRHSVGDCLTVCDGQGNDYLTEITDIGEAEVMLHITEVHRCAAEPVTDVTLFQCVPKSGKLETVIQKVTELGATKIVPVNSKRAVAKMEGESKLKRCRKVAAEAAKQCGRGRIPTVSEPVSFSEAVRQLGECELAVMPYEAATEGSLRKCLSKHPKSVGILIGPEGGFDDVEVAQARAAGLEIVTLGTRILRTETAGMAVIAMVMYELEL